jgi:hypothetical protein
MCPEAAPPERRQMSIEDVTARHEDMLLALPNVVGVGIGERDGRPVIKAFVTESVPESALAPDERVPESLEGFEVDVEPIGDIEVEGRKDSQNGST